MIDVYSRPISVLSSKPVNTTPAWITELRSTLPTDHKEILPSAYGAWLATKPWSAFATLTFSEAETITIDAAQRRYKTFLQRLQTDIQCRIVSFAVLESRHAIGDLHQIKPHWHVLLSVPRHKEQLLIDTAQTN